MKKIIIPALIATLFLASACMLLAPPPEDEYLDAAPSGNWIDYADTSWYKSGGGEFTIDNEAELAGLMKLATSSYSLSSSTFMLTKDLDLSAHYWTPIAANQGNRDISFAGTFIGNNHTISGMMIGTASNPYGGEAGLFAEVENGTVRGVNITNSIIHVKELGYFTPVQTTYSKGSGGIAGTLSKASITQCSFSGNIIPESGSSHIGGIVGYSSFGNIDNCSNYGTILGLGSSQIGGIVGQHEGNNSYARINKCYNMGNIVGNTNVGGIAGYSRAMLFSSYNTGTILGNDLVGGIAGTNAQEVLRCYNKGTVFSDNDKAGGIVGVNATQWPISMCYNVGTVNNPLIGSGNVNNYENSYWLASSTSSTTGARSESDMTGSNAKNKMTGFDSGWTAVNDVSKNDTQYNAYFLQVTDFVNAGGKKAADSTASVQITREKMTPIVNISGSYDYNYGSALSSKTPVLAAGSTPGTLKWNVNYTLTNTSTISYPATFTPTDTVHYKTLTNVSVPLTVIPPAQTGVYVFDAGGLLRDQTILEKKTIGGVSGTWSWTGSNINTPLRSTDTKAKLKFTPTAGYAVSIDVDIAVNLIDPVITVDVSRSYCVYYGSYFDIPIRTLAGSTPGTLTGNGELMDDTNMFQSYATFIPNDQYTYKCVYDVLVDDVTVEPPVQTGTYVFAAGTLPGTEPIHESPWVGAIYGLWTWEYPDTSVAPGDEWLGAWFTPDDSQHKVVYTIIQITVSDKLTPDVRLTPGTYEFTYGDFFSSKTLLRDEGGTPGTLTWNAPVVGNINATTAYATFTPTDTAAYETITNVSIPITVGTPAQNGAAYVFAAGDTLTGKTINQTAPVGAIVGSFKWGDPVTALKTTDTTTWIRFGPINEDYTTFTMEITITVNPAIPTVNVTGTYGYVYGESLLNISVITHADTDTPGTILWDDPSTVLGKTGTYDVDAIFMPTDGNTYSIKLIKVSVNVTVPPAIDYTYGYGEMLYSQDVPEEGNIGDVSGTYAWKTADKKFTALGSDTAVLTFTPDDSEYTAVDVGVAITVNKGTPDVTMDDNRFVYGTSLTGSMLDYDSSVPGTLVLDGTTAILDIIGTMTLDAIFTPTDGTNYNEVTLKITVTVSEPTQTGNYQYDYNQTLGEKNPAEAVPVGAISGTYSWVDPTQKVDGDFWADIEFIPNSPLYSGFIMKVWVTTYLADPTVNVTGTYEYEYGDALSENPVITHESTDTPGTITWLDDSTILGEIGTYTMNVEFIPDDVTTYKRIIVQVTVTVSKPSQAGTYEYDSGAMLSAKAPSETVPVGAIDGTYAWADPTTVVDGDFWADLLFTPSSSSYEGFTLKVWVTAVMTEPTVNVTGTYEYDYGDALSRYTVTHASTDTPGTITWFDDSVLVGKVGTYTIDAKFTPVDTTTYKWITVQVPVTVSKPVLNVTYTYGLGDDLYSQGPPGTTTYGGISGTYVWDSSDETLNVASDTTRVVRFTPTSTSYSEFTTDVRIVVGKSVPTVTVDISSSTYGTVVKNVTVTFDSSTPGKIVWDDETAVLGKLGNVMLGAKFVPDDTTLYVDVDVTVTINVTKPSQAGTYAYTTGMKLSDIAVKQTAPVGGVAGTFAWENGDNVMNEEGTFNRNIVFTPSDTTKYEGFTMSVSVTVSAVLAPTDDGGDNTMIIVAVVAVVVIGALGAAYFLFIRKP